MPAGSTNIKDLFHSLTLFTDLTGLEIDRLYPNFRLTAFKSGDRLLREGEMVRSLFVIVAGEASVLKEDKTGEPREIATVGARTVLGEMSLFEFVQASATIEAKGPLEALVIERMTLTRTMDANPQLGYKILKKIVRIMGKRLKTTSDQLTEYLPDSQA